MAGLKGIKAAAEAARKAAQGSRRQGVLSKLEQEIGSEMGEFGRQRVQRAADEIPGLERLYSPEALKQAFGARGLMTLPPTRFEDFASPLGALDPDYVSKLARVRRYDDVPYLDIDRPMAGIDRPIKADWLAIAGHEGRHRNRAMAQRGDPAGLVRVEPNWGGRLGKEVDALVPIEGPMRPDEGRLLVKPSPEERLARMREVLGEGRMVRPQSALWGPQRDLRQLPELYSGGGRVGALGKMAEAVSRARQNAQGRPVHPTAEGQENFGRWFGESKIADTEGRPTVAYTGTSKDVPFKSFKVPRNGAWFTTDPKSASSYAITNDSRNLRHIPGTHRFEEVNTASRVIPAYLRVENPYSMTAEDLNRIRHAQNYKREQGMLFDRLRREGYDGVDMGDGVTVVIGNPRQIKSAIGNQGTFGDVDDIAKADGGGVGMAKGGDVKMAKGGLRKATEAVRKAAQSARNAPPSAMDRRVVALDHLSDLNLDDITVLFPEALTRVDDVEMSNGGLPPRGRVGALAKASAAVRKAAQEAAAPKSGIEEILQAQQPPMTTPRGTGLPLMPRSQGMYTPDIPQVDLPRMPSVDRARAAGVAPKYTPRMQDLLDSDKARRKLNLLVDKGEELGMREWYGTEPFRQVAMDVGLSPQEYQELLAQLASASQRNPVDQQNKMGSYLWHLSRTGQLPEDAFLMTNKIRRGEAPMPEGTPIALPEGYGSLAQGDIFGRGKQIASGDIEGALPPERKLGTFYRNLQGNLRPVTVDVNAVRGPVIEVGDPRWLASKLVEKDDKGNVIATHFPRRDVQSGLMSIRQAQQRPGFWEAAPSGSEYAGFEDLWQRASRRKGAAPAEAQALGWYGSADVTALKTAPELYVDNLEQLIRGTAGVTGRSPTETMRRFILGLEPLQDRAKAEGGVIRAFKDDKEANAWFDGLQKAGAVMMAQGGVPQLGPASEGTIPDSSDGGIIKYSEGYADGGAATVNPIMARRAAREREGKDPFVGNVVESLSKAATNQAKEEAASMNARGVIDVINRGLIADTLGSPVDLINMGLQSIGLGSDVPVGGSQHIRDLFDRYGITSGTERPMMETAMALFGPGRVASAVRGAPGAIRSAESGMNRARAAAARPFTPATVTMEAVAPDLGQMASPQWKQTVTRRLTGPGAPVSMETIAGRETVKRPGQGAYLNEAGELETNPMVAVDVPGVGDISANRPFRADVSTAGQELAQESVAAHRFLPMMTQNPADANAMLISGRGRPLTNEEVAALAEQLPHMVVAHNPRMGGVVVMPYETREGVILPEFGDAMAAARSVLGNSAAYTYGRADPNKDRMYVGRSDYLSEGARAPSPASTMMRDRLKAAEGRMKRGKQQELAGQD